MKTGEPWRCLPPSAIRMTDPFWAPRQDLLLKVTLSSQFEQIVSTGRLENFRAAARGEAGTYRGYCFNDSDVYKWLEACAYALRAGGEDPAAGRLGTMVEETVAAIQAAQEPDGYINTFFQLNHPHLKWRNLVTMHEMYCSGHLIEAGVAMKECLGEDRLLSVAIRLADHILSIFGPGRRPGYCGHEEIELALMRLTDVTGEPRYAEHAAWQIEQRGRRPSPFEKELDDAEAMALSPWTREMFAPEGAYRGEYAQDHAPIREHTEVVGHAVRAMYLYTAAARIARNDAGILRALERVWHNLTRRRMYISGGIGPSAKNEGFTSDYDLPNLTAYSETCAAIGLVMWAKEMLHATGDSEYADVMERALYNAVVSGISLSGDRYFYTNPLESRGNHARVPWFECACCPPNIARLIGSIERYVAACTDEEFVIHVPAGLEADLSFRGVPTKITVESGYPWAGNAVVRVEPKSPVEFAIRIRIPDWAEDVRFDTPEEGGYESGYAVFRRTWRPGDTVGIELPMHPRWVSAHPRILDDLGRQALMRGPLLYCAEGPAELAPQQFVARDGPLEDVWDSDHGGAMSIRVPGGYIQSSSEEPYMDPRDIEAASGTLTMIPYYRWNNLGPAHMATWLLRS